jgi:hypothetical protein
MVEGFKERRATRRRLKRQPETPAPESGSQPDEVPVPTR